ncbi:hypothetical protein [Terricaulis sp.]|uniref:hypothetical protein n=1 Tax=Terricaulis sp. TaxID=2768686 RepID=UPI0037850A1B
MIKGLLAIALGAAIAACAANSSLLPADRVRDPASAIRIAREACAGGIAPSVGEGWWRTRLRDRVWRVWLTAPDERAPSYEIYVQAADGSSEGCMIAVRAD